MIFVGVPAGAKSPPERRAEAGVTGGVNPRIDGAGWTGEEKGPSRRFGLFNGMAVQIDRLSVALSV
jgi:hypothetical protein